MNFECILTGDTGSGNDDQYLVSESMSKLIAKNPKIQSVMIVGDNIYPDGCQTVDDEQFIGVFLQIFYTLAQLYTKYNFIHYPYKVPYLRVKVISTGTSGTLRISADVWS